MSSNAEPSSLFAGRLFLSLWFAMALILAATNLRGGIVVIGPLVESIRASLDISASAFGLLMTLPLICFGIVSILVPKLASLFSPQALVIGSLLFISLGVALRLVDNYSWVIFGTLVLGAAVALLNVLIPGLVKAFFPNQLGLMTGLYSVTLTAGAGIAMYVAVPLEDSFGSWRYSLALWAILPLICIVFWLPLLRVKSVERLGDRQKLSLWRDATAWSVTLYMGLQSLFFYSLATWLPQIFIESGLDAEQAGINASLINIVSIPFNLCVPLLAAKMRSQQPLVVVVLLTSGLGTLGLLWSPAAAPTLWGALLGVGCGCSMALALSFFVLRSKTVSQATSLSAMAQSIGYFIAALGPVSLGFMHEVSTGWYWPLLLLLLLQVLQFIFGWRAARAAYVVADASYKFHQQA
jgi:CP family cyanate transporter-like MFS transporter